MTHTVRMARWVVVFAPLNRRRVTWRSQSELRWSNKVNLRYFATTRLSVNARTRVLLERHGTMTNRV